MSPGNEEVAKIVPAVKERQALRGRGTRDVESMSLLGLAHFSWCQKLNDFCWSRNEVRVSG